MKEQRIFAGLLAAFLVTLPGALAQKSNDNAKPVSHADAHLANLTTRLTLTLDEKTKSSQSSTTNPRRSMPSRWISHSLT